MRLFADQDVYALTVTFLTSLGHEVQTAAEAGLSSPASMDDVFLVVEEARYRIRRLDQSRG